MAQLPMRTNRASGLIYPLLICVITGMTLNWQSQCGAAYTFDIVSEALNSPLFRDKPPLEKLRLAVDLLKTQRVRSSDISFLVLDWADQYLRSPRAPFARLKRWAQLAEDEQLSRLRLPRDFLNRALLAEYLVRETGYLKAGPKEKLRILAKLSEQNLVDWSVSLAYARIYAGAVVISAETSENPTPMETLRALKRIKEEGLIGWHYRVPTEALLCAEALAMDEDYRAAGALEKLQKLEEMQESGLITALTRKELERLPAWRLLAQDESFLKGTPRKRRGRLNELKDKGLILSSTSTELERIFCNNRGEPGLKPQPNPLPPNIHNR